MAHADNLFIKPKSVVCQNEIIYTPLANCVESSYSFHRFPSNLAEIYVKVNISPWHYLGDWRPFDKVLWLAITFVQSWSAFFLGNADFINCPKAVRLICVDHIHLWAVIVCKLLSGNMVPIMPTTVILKNDVDNDWSVTGNHIKSPTLCSWDQQSLPGATWASIEDNHIKRKPCHSTHLEAEEFSFCCPGSGWSWSGEWTPSRPHVPRTFSSDRISLKTSRPMPQTDSSSSLPPTHVGRHAPKLEPSALVSSDIDAEYRFSLYRSDHRVFEFHLFLGRNNY